MVRPNFDTIVLERCKQVGNCQRPEWKGERKQEKPIFLLKFNIMYLQNDL